MYRMLIVDDEEIEREGMARFIPWEEYDVELIGTAWNGVEGYEKIQSDNPDIVLTDIKMPIMDGIELIRRTKKIFPEIEFVVLSGYGEFEFTSKAMEEGVRHYLLKPCDEEQITEVLDKVKKEIELKRERAKKEKEYQSTVNHLLPRAREQVFRDMLLDKDQRGQEYELFLKEYGTKDTMEVLLAFWKEKGFDYLERFILENILSELLGEEHVHLVTSVGENVLFLLDAPVTPRIRMAVERLSVEFKKINPVPLLVALSDPGSLAEVRSLYMQVQELIKIGRAEGQTGLLHYGLFRELRSSASYLVDYEKIRATGDYGELLFEVYFTFFKMKMEHYTFERKEEVAGWVLKVLYGVKLSATYDPDVTEEEKTWELLEWTVDAIAEGKKIDTGKGKEGERIKSILKALFRYLGKQELNIQFLAKEVLYMNEDYFSRVFVRNRKVKFSEYLLEQRILFAQRIFQYKPELKIAEVAQMTGYSPDGQYFSKAFKKITDKTPTEYRDMLKAK